MEQAVIDVLVSFIKEMDQADWKLSKTFSMSNHRRG
ncbi:hypothetical protein N752_03480 [Desulforamulus aquiferis]|nr:hypothetical protein N752_03480 [Desulforamulus aquiferis]